MQKETGTPLTASTPQSASAPEVPRAGVVLSRTVWLAALVTFVADVGTKIWALHTLTPGRPVPLLGRYFQLNLVGNPGAAFSVGDGKTWLVTLFALLVLAWLVRMAMRVTHRQWALCLGLLIGGALGNLLDRLIRAPGPGRGHVVDFLDYAGLFVGNVADIAIVAAALILTWLAFRGIPMNSNEKAPADD